MSISSSSLHLRKNSTHSFPAQKANFGLSFLADHQNPEISLFNSKGFSEISSLINGRALHCFCLRISSNLSVFHTNTLINLYFRFGKPAIALKLFDKMAMKNHSSWNTVVSGCVRAGCSGRAAELFRLMREMGGKPGGFMLASLVTACSEEGIQIHCLVAKLGLMRDAGEECGDLDCVDGELLGQWAACGSRKSISEHEKGRCSLQRELVCDGGQFMWGS